MSCPDPLPTKTPSKKRAWSVYIPRPGSSSGLKSSSSNDSTATATVNTVSSPTRSSNGFSFGKRPGSRSKGSLSALTTPQEGKQLKVFPPQPQAVTSSRSVSSSVNASANSSSSTLSHFGPETPATPLFGARAADGERRTPPSRPSSRPSTPKRWASSLLTSSPENEAPRSSSEHTRMASGKSYLSNMIGGLSLSISRTSTRDDDDEEREREKDRGRTIFKPSSKRPKSSSHLPQETDTPATSRSRSGARSQSPFFFRRRQRDRDPSPTIQSLPLANSETDLSDTSSIQPRTAFTDFADSGDETIDYSDDDCEAFDDFLDPVTERNTEHNAIIIPASTPDAVIDEAEPDPLGEGVNVVVPPEPYFPSTLNSLDRANTRNKRNPRRRKSTKHHEPLPFKTCRPVFERDRCTITVKQGDPKLSTRRKRKYVVASDLSEESKYAVEWGIGTVLRDGDEMLIVTVVENESKGELFSHSGAFESGHLLFSITVDPEVFNPSDRTAKLRSQQERQGLAYILVRQVTGLLQRTRLNVAVSCQAWHAKNARHMLLDIVDYTQPTMLIVGSRGLSQLSGILLGSTSHYLIQKCSVPVMVARRRLKRPPKKSAHLSTHRQHVKLSEAGIDRVAAKVDQDVQVMREEMQKDEKKRDGGPGSRDDRQVEALLEAQEDEEGEEGEGSVSGENDGGRSPEAVVGKEGDNEPSERVST